MINDEKMALLTDPFYEDFGDPEFTILSDKIVTVRKPRPCCFCNRQIVQRERARVTSSVLGGEMARHIWCADCLNEMVRLDEGGLPKGAGK